MPVRFKGVSEYSNSFKWSPSFRSAEFKPADEQMAPEAGLRSDQMNLLVEPTFTRKRQVPHRKPETPSLMMWWEDDYTEPTIENIQTGAEGRNAQNKTYVIGKKSSPPKDKAGKVSQKKTKKDETKVEKENKYEEVKKADDAVVKENKTSSKKGSKGKQVRAEKDVVERSNNNVLAQKTQSDSFPKKKSRKVTSEPKQAPEKKESPKPESPSKKIPFRYRPRKMRYTSAHLSEYQQMYRKPTRFVPSSPLISALDVVHNSSHAIPPHKSPRMPAKSEYESKFQNMSPLSKSLPVYSSPPSPSLKLKVKNLPTSPMQVHRSPKKVASEYARQFPNKNFPVESQEKLWEAADRNKLNRDASNFDKSHAIQLLSPKNKYWDMSSTGSHTVTEADTNDNEDVRSTESVAGSDNDHESVESVISMEQDSLATMSAHGGDSNGNNIGDRPVARKLAWGDGSETVSDADGPDDETITGSDAEGPFEGRLPTPQLKQIGGALRTHHDLTTPCSGGALLSSPPVSPRCKTYPQSRLQLDTKPASPAKAEPTKVSRQEKMSTYEKKVVAPKPKPSKEPSLPRRMLLSPRAPIQGTLRDSEFQHYGRNTRPPTALDQVSIASSRSSASAVQLLERSLQRKDFWQK